MENFYISVVVKVAVGTLKYRDLENKVMRDEISKLSAYNLPDTCNPWVIPTQLSDPEGWPIGKPVNFTRALVWRRDENDAGKNIDYTYVGLNFPTFVEFTNWLSTANAQHLLGLADEMHINKVLGFSDLE